MDSEKFYASIPNLTYRFKTHNILKRMNTIFSFIYALKHRKSE